MTKTFGQRIKQARKTKGMTQKELAMKIGLPSHVTISEYENDKRGCKKPNIQMLVKIANELDISIDWLFLGKK